MAQQQQPQMRVSYMVTSLPMGLKSGTITESGKIIDAVWAYPTAPATDINSGSVFPAVEKPVVKSAA